MRTALEYLVSYTHTLKPVYDSTIKGEFQIKKVNDKLVISVPSSANIAKYAAGAKIYIMGNEVVQTLPIYMGRNDWPEYLDGFYTDEGSYTINVRDFIGSKYNGGFWQIESITDNDITLKLPDNMKITDFIEEDFKGLIFITAWNTTNSSFIKLKNHVNADSFGSGITSEKVKNYSYSMNQSKINTDTITGLPKVLISPFKQSRRMPQNIFTELKRCIYE